MAQIAPDFSNLLSQPADTFKRPPTKPPGTYSATIAGFKFDKSSQKGTPLVRFTFNNVQPGEDIAPDQLNDEEGKPIEFQKWTPTIDFYITQDALFRLSEFLASLGINIAGRGINELLPETRNLPVLLTVSMKPNQDNTGFINRVENVIAAS